MSLSIIYAHYEGSPDFKANLLFFLKTGYIEDSNINYIFVINGQSTVSFPKKANVSVVYRENRGYDFAGHAEGLKLLTRKYDYYLFINLLKSDPTVKLVGSTINIEPASCIIDRISPHVQSYIFMMDDECLSFLQSEHIFDQSYDKIIDVIVNQEIGMSEKILSNGWNISCLVPEFQGKDYRSKDLTGKIIGNILSPTNPLGRVVHPYEVIFMKTNRNIAHQELATLTHYYQRLPAEIKTVVVPPVTSPNPSSISSPPPDSKPLGDESQTPISLTLAQPQVQPQVQPLPQPQIKPIKSILKSNKRASSEIRPNYRVIARNDSFIGDMYINQMGADSHQVSGMIYNIKPPITQSNQNQIKPPLSSGQNQYIKVKPPIYNQFQDQPVQSMG